jgi:diaminopimelate epimerase
MKKYLRMSDVFDMQPIRLPSSWSYEMVAHAIHAIDIHDELVAMNKELLAALEGLLSDMRLRAKLDGDVDSDGCVVLSCGNGVLCAANQAIEKARAAS